MAIERAIEVDSSILKAEGDEKLPGGLPRVRTTRGGKIVRPRKTDNIVRRIREAQKERVARKRERDVMGDFVKHWEKSGFNLVSLLDIADLDFDDETLQDWFKMVDFALAKETNGQYGEGGASRPEEDDDSPVTLENGRTYPNHHEMIVSALNNYVVPFLNKNYIETMVEDLLVGKKKPPTDEQMRKSLEAYQNAERNIHDMGDDVSDDEYNAADVKLTKARMDFASKQMIPEWIYTEEDHDGKSMTRTQAIKKYVPKWGQRDVARQIIRRGGDYGVGFIADMGSSLDNLEKNPIRGESRFRLPPQPGTPEFEAEVVGRDRRVKSNLIDKLVQLRERNRYLHELIPDDVDDMMEDERALYADHIDEVTHNAQIISDGLDEMTQDYDLRIANLVEQIERLENKKLEQGALGRSFKQAERLDALKESLEREEEARMSTRKQLVTQMRSDIPHRQNMRTVFDHGEVLSPELQSRNIERMKRMKRDRIEKMGGIDNRIRSMAQESEFNMRHADLGNESARTAILGLFAGSDTRHGLDAMAAVRRRLFTVDERGDSKPRTNIKELQYGEVNTTRDKDGPSTKQMVSAYLQLFRKNRPGMTSEQVKSEIMQRGGLPFLRSEFDDEEDVERRAQEIRNREAAYGARGGMGDPARRRKVLMNLPPREQMESEVANLNPNILELANKLSTVKLRQFTDDEGELKDNVTLENIISAIDDEKLFEVINDNKIAVLQREVDRLDTERQQTPQGVTFDMGPLDEAQKRLEEAKENVSSAPTKVTEGDFDERLTPKKDSQDAYIGMPFDYLAYEKAMMAEAQKPLTRVAKFFGMSGDELLDAAVRVMQDHPGSMTSSPKAAHFFMNELKMKLAQAGELTKRMQRQNSRDNFDDEMNQYREELADENIPDERRNEIIDKMNELELQTRDVFARDDTGNFIFTQGNTECPDCKNGRHSLAHRHPGNHIQSLTASDREMDTLRSKGFRGGTMFTGRGTTSLEAPFTTAAGTYGNLGRGARLRMDPLSTRKERQEDALVAQRERAVQQITGIDREIQDIRAVLNIDENGESRKDEDGRAIPSEYQQKINIHKSIILNHQEAKDQLQQMIQDLPTIEDIPMEQEMRTSYQYALMGDSSYGPDDYPQFYDEEGNLKNEITLEEEGVFDETDDEDASFMSGDYDPKSMDHSGVNVLDNVPKEEQYPDDAKGQLNYQKDLKRYVATAIKTIDNKIRNHKRQQLNESLEHKNDQERLKKLMTFVPELKQSLQEFDEQNPEIAKKRRLTYEERMERAQQGSSSQPTGESTLDLDGVMEEKPKMAETINRGAQQCPGCIQGVSRGVVKPAQVNTYNGLLDSEGGVCISCGNDSEEMLDILDEHSDGTESIEDIHSSARERHDDIDDEDEMAFSQQQEAYDPSAIARGSSVPFSRVPVGIETEAVAANHMKKGFRGVEGGFGPMLSFLQRALDEIRTGGENADAMKLQVANIMPRAFKYKFRGKGDKRQRVKSVLPDDVFSKELEKFIHEMSVQEHGILHHGDVNSAGSFWPNEHFPIQNALAHIQASLIPLLSEESHEGVRQHLGRGMEGGNNFTLPFHNPLKGDVSLIDFNDEKKFITAIFQQITGEYDADPFTNRRKASSDSKARLFGRSGASLRYRDLFNAIKQEYHDRRHHPETWKMRHDAQNRSRKTDAFNPGGGMTKCPDCGGHGRVSNDTYMMVAPNQYTDKEGVEHQGDDAKRKWMEENVNIFGSHDHGEGSVGKLSFARKVAELEGRDFTDRDAEDAEFGEIKGLQHECRHCKGMGVCSTCGGHGGQDGYDKEPGLHDVFDDDFFDQYPNLLDAMFPRDHSYSPPLPDEAFSSPYALKIANSNPMDEMQSVPISRMIQAMETSQERGQRLVEEPQQGVSLTDEELNQYRQQQEARRQEEMQAEMGRRQRLEDMSLNQSPMANLQDYTYNPDGTLAEPSQDVISQEQPFDIQAFRPTYLDEQTSPTEGMTSSQRLQYAIDQAAGDVPAEQISAEEKYRKYQEGESVYPHRNGMRGYDVNTLESNMQNNNFYTLPLFKNWSPFELAHHLPGRFVSDKEKFLPGGPKMKGTKEGFHDHGDQPLEDGANTLHRFRHRIATENNPDWTNGLAPAPAGVGMDYLHAMNEAEERQKLSDRLKNLTEWTPDTKDENGESIPYEEAEGKSHDDNPIYDIVDIHYKDSQTGNILRSEKGNHYFHPQFGVPNLQNKGHQLVLAAQNLQEMRDAEMRKFQKKLDNVGDDRVEFEKLQKEMEAYDRGTPTTEISFRGVPINQKLAQQLHDLHHNGGTINNPTGDDVVIHPMEQRGSHQRLQKLAEDNWKESAMYSPNLFYMFMKKIIDERLPQAIQAAEEYGAEESDPIYSEIQGMREIKERFPEMLQYIKTIHPSWDEQMTLSYMDEMRRMENDGNVLTGETMDISNLLLKDTPPPLSTTWLLLKMNVFLDNIAIFS